MKALEHFGKFISQERHIIILIRSAYNKRAYCFYFKVLFKGQLVFAKNYECHIFSAKICMMEDHLNQLYTINILNSIIEFLFNFES